MNAPPRASVDVGASLPIADYGLLSDCSSAALVSRFGSVDWLCLPRFDSPAVFARILDRGAGHWSLRPSAPATAVRVYVEGSLAIETRMSTDSGTIRLLDALAADERRR